MLYPGLSRDAMLDAYRKQYLERIGWVKSVDLRAAVDADGKPLPWLTYPAIRFLEKRARPDWKVFEFGCGASTLWWSDRVASVHSVDHDEQWLNDVSASSRKNVTARLHRAGDTAENDIVVDGYFRDVVEVAPTGDEGFRQRAGLISEPFRAYVSELTKFAPGTFDVVVVDGMARSLATWVAIHAQPKRFIVFDNSDRPAYATAYSLLDSAGYKRIDFWGTGPINPYEWCTSVFVRSLEVLN